MNAIKSGAAGASMDNCGLFADPEQNIRRGNVLAIGTTMFSCDRCPWRTVYSPKFNEMLQMQSSLPGSCVRRAQSDVDDNCLCLAD